MCPEHEVLERLALGLLSEEELAPVEEHLETCQRCVLTLLENNVSDTVIEALAQAPQVLERRAEIEDGVRRVKAGFWAKLRDPYRTRPESGRQSKPSDADDPDDTSATGSRLATPSPVPESRTTPDGDDASFSFLSPALSADEIGRLGPYRVLRVLGTGGMGVVFEAEDPQLKRHVALKAMKPGVAASSSARKRFLREAQTAAAVEHDHIVPVYQVGEDRGVPFIAMPLLRGETLAERLERRGSGFGVQGSGEEKAEGKRQKAEEGTGNRAEGADNPKSKIENPKSPLPLDELLRIGREVALGLAAAHRRGLIHRDIKPSNIWLEEETGRAKILDFGLARAGDGGEQLTQAGAMLGTPAYMSPEQASGDDLDARSDLFSLGCVLYQCATGRRAFIGRDALTTMVAVTTVTPPAPRELNPELPSEMNDLIVSLLSKDPALRPQTAREVAERLASVRNGLRAVPAEGSGFGVQGSAERADDDPRAYSSPHAPREGTHHAERDAYGGQAADAALLPLPPGEGRGEGGLSHASDPTTEPSPVLMGNAHPTKPPRRRGLILLASAAGAAALLATIVITIKNEKDEAIAQFESDKPVVFDKLGPGTKVIVEEKAKEGSGEPKGAPVQGSATEIKTQDPSPTTSSPNPKSKIQNRKSPPSLPAMSAMSLVTEPAAIPGAKSWALETIDHRGDIYKMEFNLDGTLLATYGEDGAVRLWNSETGQLARIFVGADSPSGGIAWSPDGASIAVAAGGKIKAWHAATGKPACTIGLIDGEAASLAWSPNGKTFAVGQRPIDQPEAPARRLCLYDLATGKLVTERHRDDWSVEQIAWSPDGKRLLIDDPRGVNWLCDAVGNELQSIAVPTDGGYGRHLAWTVDGAPLVAGTNKHALCVWRAQPLEILHRFAPAPESTFNWHALSSDGRFAVGGLNWHGHALWGERGGGVFDCATGQRVRGFDRLAASKDATGWEAVPRYAMSRDGRRVARHGVYLGGPVMLDMDSGDAIRRRALITGHHYVRFMGTWLGDETLGFITGADAACLLDARTLYPRVITVPQAELISDLKRSADGRRFTMVNYRARVLRQYSCETGEIAQVGEATPGVPRLSDDGELIAGLLESGRVGIFDAAERMPPKTLDAASDTPVTWSPDNKRIAVSRGSATEIWDIEANECVWRSDVGVGLVTWSAVGDRFVFGSNGEATIHDAKLGNVLHSLDDAPAASLEAGVNHWPRFAWSPDARWIAGCGRIWDAETGEVIARLPGAALAGEIGSPAWSPDGATLAYLGPGRAVVVADVAPKVRHSIAQGETLGNEHAQNTVALKGRHSDGSQGADAGESRPVGADNSNAAVTQGSAALHPGLWNMTPSGSPQVAATLLTFNRGQVLSIAPSGHYRASPRADELLVYVVETAAGQETLSREQFAERFGWKNNVGWALPTARTELNQRLADATPDGGEMVANAHPTPMSDMALVQKSAVLPGGVASWTIAPRVRPDAKSQMQPIDLSRDGKLLAHAAPDGAVGLIDTSTGKTSRLFVGHDTPLTAVQFSPDGRLLASLDAIVGNTRIWDASTGAQIHSVYSGNGRPFSTLHWSPDGAILAIASEHAPLRLLDAAKGEFLPQPVGHDVLPGPGYFAWSPDGRRFASAVNEDHLFIWDTATLEPALAIEGKGIPASLALAWSPDGAMLAAYAGTGEIRVWNPATGKLLTNFTEEHPNWYAGIAWLRDRKTIAINTERGAQGWRLWDITREDHAGDIVPYGCIWGFALSRDGETLALSGQRLGIFNVPKRALVREIETAGWAESAAWSPNSRELAVTSDSETAVWTGGKSSGLAMLPTENWWGAHWLPGGDGILNTAGGGANLLSRRAHAWQMKHLSINVGNYGGDDTACPSPDGKRIACSNNEIKAEDGGKRRVEIWDVAAANRLTQAEPLGEYLRALAFSPDGTLLAAGTEDGASAIYDAATGKCLATLPAANASIRPLAFSPDGKTLAAGYGGNGNGSVRLYDVDGIKASGHPEGTWRQASGEEDGKPASEADRPHPSPLPEGEGARADASGNPKSKIENPKSLRMLHELRCDQSAWSPEICALHWSADSGTLHVLDHAAVYVFDAATGDLLAKVPRLDRTPHGARPANFSPDGRFLAVATTCTRVWDLAELNEAAAEKASGIRRQASVADGKAESDAKRPHPSPLPEGKRTRADASDNPKSKIENPKLHLVASVVPLGHGQAVVVSADGHWLGTRGAEKEIVYVIKTANGQETLAPREFYKRFGWKNDPSKVLLP